MTLPNQARSLGSCWALLLIVCVACASCASCGSGDGDCDGQACVARDASVGGDGGTPSGGDAGETWRPLAMADIGTPELLRDGFLFTEGPVWDAG